VISLSRPKKARYHRCDVAQAGEALMPEAIRTATIADADDIAALHAASWRSAYRGILKDSTLGPTLDGDRRTHWRGELAAMAPADTVLIADGRGFIAAWAAGDPGFGAYIDNLHVHPERRSAGLGRHLLGAAMRQVAARGEARAYLWVFDGNTRAIEFYRRLGGEIVEHGFEEIDGLTIPQSRIVWRDTLRLAEACA
jgi:ribosomal protein S18 acetylase RimI-like enzyme